jgi:GNAT superfamily N-acetyltransferase
MADIISPVSSQPIKIVRLDQVRDETLFHGTVDFLRMNLPFESMQRTAARIPYNRANLPRTISCLDGEAIVGAVFGGLLNSDCSYLEFLWLRDVYRGTGLGKAALGTFEGAQRESNVKFIEAETYEDKPTNWMVHMGYPIISRGLDGGRPMARHQKIL